MKKYEYRIGSYYGTIRAKNIINAEVNAIRNHLKSIPYPPDTIDRTEIIIKEIGIKI